MDKLLRFLLIFGFVVLINCKGGGGGGGFSGGVYGSGGSGSGKDGDSILLIGIIGIITLVSCCYLCCKKRKGDPKQTNEMFVASNRKDVERAGEEDHLRNAFQSGTWSCRYYQHGRWHGPHLLTLSFNNADKTIKGSGTDDIGTFAADGVYSESTRRIGLTEHYQIGTGNPIENLGHDVITQVIYNARSNQFEGKWYVHTYKYKGENEIEFKFVEPNA